jgi:hypothetical protein
MARMVYFVLAVDLDAQTVSIDDGTFTARFQSYEQVWDTDLQEWRKYEGEENEEYHLALDILNTKKLEDD